MLPAPTALPQSSVYFSIGGKLIKKYFPCVVLFDFRLRSCWWPSCDEECKFREILRHWSQCKIQNTFLSIKIISIDVNKHNDIEMSWWKASRQRAWEGKALKFFKKTKIRIIEIIMTIPWSILVLFFREKQNFKSNFIVEHKFSCLIEKIKFQQGRRADMFI